MNASLPAWVRAAQVATGVQLRLHSAGEASGPCPRCRTGVDRFVVFMEGNWWCRKCGYRGWWLSDPDERTRAAAESRAEAAERSALAESAIRQCSDWAVYHDRLLTSPEHFELWLSRGVSESGIRRFGLGYAESSPCSPDCASLTIPVWRGGVLQDIRHRLLGDDVSERGRYRSHLPGLHPGLFNLDALGSAQRVLVVEGEIKTMVLSESGFTATAGLPGATFWRTALLELPKVLDASQEVVVLLDPGAEDAAALLALNLVKMGVLASTASCPIKPDDLLLAYGKGILQAVVDQAMPVYGMVHSGGRSRDGLG